MSAPPRSSRSFTDALLAELRAGGWRPRAWGRFLGLATARSWQQARMRPRAAAEVTVMHAALALLAGAQHRAPRNGNRGPSWRWVALSWALTMTHLGMLESRRSLSAADVVTLLRASLPAVGPVDPRLLGVLACASDVVDGRLARTGGTVTPFGRDADSVADAAFWTWFALRHERSRWLRALGLAAWAAPVVAVTASSVAHGQMVDAPRPVVARPAAVMQAILAVRALRPHDRSSSS